MSKQESIPVGCVASAAVAVREVCFLFLGGVGSAKGTVCLEWVSHRGCLPGGKSARGMSARGCLPRGFYPSMHWGRHPHCEQNDWQTTVKISMCRNFIADGKNYKPLIAWNNVFIIHARSHWRLAFVTVTIQRTCDAVDLRWTLLHWYRMQWF